MPFARTSRGRPQYNARTTNRNVGGALSNSSGNFVSEQSGIRRHEFTAPIEGMGTMALGDYGELPLVQMARTFDGIDGPPTATASNNYQSPLTGVSAV